MFHVQLNPSMTNADQGVWSRSKKCSTPRSCRCVPVRGAKGITRDLMCRECENHKWCPSLPALQHLSVLSRLSFLRLFHGIRPLKNTVATVAAVARHAVAFFSCIYFYSCDSHARSGRDVDVCSVKLIVSADVVLTYEWSFPFGESSYECDFLFAYCLFTYRWHLLCWKKVTIGGGGWARASELYYCRIWHWRV